MPWTTPKTWGFEEVLPSADLNTYVRDNLNETAPAKVTTAGDLVYATGDKAITRLALGPDGTVLRAGASAPLWSGLDVGLAGANTSEGSTTSTGDVLSVTGLSIPVGVPFLVVFEFQMPAGASGGSNMEIKLNTTGMGTLATLGSTTVARSGIAFARFGARETDYLHSYIGYSVSSGPGSGTAAAFQATASGSVAMPTATITAVTVNVLTNSAGKTVAAKNLRVYTEPM